MKKMYTILSLSLLIMSSCKVAEKQFRQGDYEEAIDISVKKLQRNPEKEEYILLLEEAFKRANQNDLTYIQQLNLEGQPDRWEDIHAIYQTISRRQHKIDPLLPLFIENEDRNAVFDFIDITKEVVNAKKNAINYWYASANEKIQSENKYKAREAYSELMKIESFDTNYKDVDALLKEAKHLGTNQVWFEVENISNTILNQDVDAAIRNINPADVSGNWYQFISLTEGDYDFTVLFQVTHITSLPEKISTNHYEETKEVEDGVAYVYDDKGNVVKDSLGNPITVPKYETVSAYVSETWQEKIATVEGEIKYIDNKTGRVLKTIPVRGDGIFQNYYATAAGYYEALSQQSKQKIGGKPLPFPGDTELIINAIHTLESVMQNAMEDFNDEILNG
ncbi:MAG: hypothetical protein H7X71_02015 [Chitinophagales bacterium]|nr:hypothetical protein [Chitinophagales bacterium]